MKKLPRSSKRLKMAIFLEFRGVLPEIRVVHEGGEIIGRLVPAQHFRGQGERRDLPYFIHIRLDRALVPLARVGG
jgi:hypothetical protein